MDLDILTGGNIWPGTPSALVAVAVMAPFPSSPLRWGLFFGTEEGSPRGQISPAATFSLVH